MDATAVLAYMGGCGLPFFALRDKAQPAGSIARQSRRPWGMLLHPMDETTESRKRGADVA
jgi:hypothetical protein